MKLQKSIIAIIALITLALSINAQELPQNQFRKRMDFTGDGKADISFYRSDYSNHQGQWLTLNSANPANYSQVAFGVGEQDAPVPGDYNGDNRADYAVTRTEGGNTSWYILNAEGTSYSRTVFGLPLDYVNEMPVVADYDGDHKDDIAVARRNTANNTFTYYWLRSSDGQLGTRVVPYNPAFADCRSSVPGDYNGDFKADFIVRCKRPSDNQMFFDITDNAANTMQRIEWGLYTAVAGSLYFENGDVFAPGDYNGDGKTDIAVVRFVQTGTYVDRPTGSLYWYIRLTGSGTTYVRQYGAIMPNPSTGYLLFDRPIPGDYDGDNKTDIGIVRYHAYNLFTFIIENSSTGASVWTKFDYYNFEGYNHVPTAAILTGGTSAGGY